MSEDQILEVEIRRRLPGSPLNKSEEQPERVAVRVDGVRAGLALVDEPLGEEALKGRSERTHGRPPEANSSRSAARPSSSGAAERYQ
jgi:hypothetical protein